MGRLKNKDNPEYQNRISRLVDQLLDIQSKLTISNPGARGWCYLLEGAGAITKDRFDETEKLIGDLRKDGLLPADFCREDSERSVSNLEEIDYQNPYGYAEGIIRQASRSWGRYEPISYWDFQSTYIEMIVEKSDLRTLFDPICGEFHIPIFNSSGWPDIRCRTDALSRIVSKTSTTIPTSKLWKNQQRTCVILYCGDFDPAGLAISDRIYKMFWDVAVTAGCISLNDREEIKDDAEKALLPSIKQLKGDAKKTAIKEAQIAAGVEYMKLFFTVDRFGLNYEFINEFGLTWIPGLATSNKDRNALPLEDPRHSDHYKPYVQDYLHKYCERDEDGRWVGRKVESNALVANPDAGQQLCRDAIEKYIDQDGIDAYQAKLTEERQKARDLLPSCAQQIFRIGIPSEFENYWAQT